LQAPVLPEEASWHACSVDSSLINFGSKQENPELTKNLALEKINKGSVHIFTDAYKTIDNKTSAAFCITKFNIEHRLKLKENGKCARGQNLSAFLTAAALRDLACVAVIGQLLCALIGGSRSAFDAESVRQMVMFCVSLVKFSKNIHLTKACYRPICLTATL